MTKYRQTLYRTQFLNLELKNRSRLVSEMEVGRERVLDLSKQALVTSKFQEEHGEKGHWDLQNLHEKLNKVFKRIKFHRVPARN